MGFKGFDHPYVTVDVLVFSIMREKLSVLLSRRDNEPFKGALALPGGFVRLDESLDKAAKRVVEDKGRVGDVYLEQLYSFGKTDRDPRSRIVSVAYFALIPEDKAKNVECDLDNCWFEIDKLPRLAFDHKEIIEMGVERLRAKVGYSNIAMRFLRRSFTLGELQKVHEIILDEKLDKRNFRKKMLALDLLKESGGVSTGQHRPAKLYSFKSDNPIFF